VPIVFAIVSDPVGAGFVDSLARPGGNVTGFTPMEFGFGAKWLELIKEIAPRVTRVAVLRDLTIGLAQLGAIQSVAPLGLHIQVLDASTSRDIDEAFATFVRDRPDGVFVAGDPFFDSRRQKIVELAATHAVPTSYAWRENVVAGGLMSYGTNLADSYRQAGVLAGRVAQG